MTSSGVPALDQTRLLFLDFDGVMHPTSAGSADLFCRADALLAALDGSDCPIVISSSWRHHYPMSMLLSRLPKGISDRVIGTTGEPQVGRWPRHREIVAYVNGHEPSACWRALDDSRIEFPPGCSYLIGCDPNHGFGSSQSRALRAWLRGP